MLYWVIFVLLNKYNIFNKPQLLGQTGSKLTKYGTNYSTRVLNPKTAIVMLNMGGPQRTDQVHDYLHRIMTDRDVIQFPVAQE